MTSRRVAVGRTVARRLWLPYRSSGGRRLAWPPPRLRQLLALARCAVIGHRWGPWQVDDMDGPGEDMGDGAFMPYLSREARADEPWGTRVCRHGSWPWRCGTIEHRRPA